MIVYKVVNAIVGISCMAVTFNGYIFRKINQGMRALFFIAGVAMIYPYWPVTVAGYMSAAILLFVAKLGSGEQGGSVKRKAPGMAVE